LVCGRCWWSGRPYHLHSLDYQGQHDKVDEEDQDVEGEESQDWDGFLTDEVDEQPAVKITACFFAGLGVDDEGVEDHAEEVACDDCADEWLVARWIKGWGFWREEDKFDDGTKRK
jgi:hypothetical protein